MAEKFKNNVAATLASSITATSTTLALTSGDGAQFPVIASGTANTFRISLWDKNGSVEIISICRRESGSDTLYIGTGTSHQAAGNVLGRGQESTTALAITSSDYHTIKMSITAAQIEDAIKFSSLGDLTATTTEINAVCDACTATAAELSEIHSSGAVAADYVKLHAITASAASLSNATNMVYGSATAVLRIIQVVFAYSSVTQSSVTITSIWNGDTLTSTNVSDSSAYYDFDVTGTCLGVLGVVLTSTTSLNSMTGVLPWAMISGTNLRLGIGMNTAGSINFEDILTGTGDRVTFSVSYLTSA